MHPDSTPAPLGEGDSVIIRLEVNSVGSLVDPGNSPFRGPRMHPDVGGRILQIAHNFPKATHFTVEFLVPDACNASMHEAREALAVLAAESKDDAEKELREIFRNGRLSLLVGFLAVMVLLGLTELLLLLGGESATVRAITESLIIVYWVILWRPAELLLYDHFPVRRRRKAADVLARAELRLIDTHAGLASTGVNP
jgi:hypothetical protein